MVRDLRFSKRKYKDIADAEYAKRLLIPKSQVVEIRHRSPEYEKIISKYLKDAIKEFTGESIPCNISEIDDFTNADHVSSELRRENEKQIVKIKECFDIETLTYLKYNSEVLLKISGHVFEKIIAEILASSGFDDISLNVMTEAGEVDIIGFSKDHLGGKIGYVFELRQTGLSKRKIELKEVTRLFGIRESLRQRLGIHQGIFVTTTDYTQKAHEFGNVWHLGLKNHNDVLEWIKQYELKGNGLYLKPD